MSTLVFVEELRRKGIHLHAEGDELVCRASPGLLTSDLTKRLREDKDELLSFLREDKPIPVIPLSPTQFGLWFLNELEGGKSTTYNTSYFYRLSGLLDTNAFTSSLDTIYNRQDSLRTTFDQVGGHPHQVIGAEGSFPLGHIDLRSEDAIQQEISLHQLVQTYSETPFDLKAGPCVRAVLVQLSELEHYFIFSIHHILIDGWSMGVFRREFSSIYRAHSKGEVAELPDLPIQYSDYSQRKLEDRGSAAAQESLNYWVEHLSGAPDMADIKTDRPRPAIQSFRGGVFRFTIDQEIEQAVKRLSRQYRGSVFITLTMALNILLKKYSGQDDIVIGAVSANRVLSDYDNLIGFFATTLAIRTDLSGTPTVKELFSRIRTVVFEAQAHQNVAFEQVVAALPIRRDSSRSALFQIMLVYQNTPKHELELEGLTVEIDRRSRTDAMFDILLSIGPTHDGLDVDIRYATDLYNEDTIAQIAADFTACLKKITANPDMPMTDW